MAISSKTIGDLVPDVIDALQGRTDVASIAPKYIKRALQEITESYPFEELRVTGPNVSLSIGQAIYPVSVFMNVGDDYTSNESFSIYVDFPGNTVVGNIDYKTPKAIEVMIAPATQGIPSRWTRYGKNIHLGPTPNNTYTVFMRYQQRYSFGSDASLSGAPLLVPDSWEEIVSYAAALRIAIVKRWTDQRKELHDLLYGDPEFMISEGKRGRPGLIAARIFQVERDQRFNTRQITPVTVRYNAR